MRTLIFWLSLILIFIIPWENVVSIANIGTLSRGVGLGVAILWLMMVVVSARFRKLGSFQVAVCLFVLWNTISVFWTVDVNMTVERIVTYAQLLGLIFILWDLYTTPTALRAGLQAYVLGAYVSIGSTVTNYLLGNKQNLYQVASASGFNTDDVSLIMALGIPVAFYLAASDTNHHIARLFIWINYAYIPAAYLGIILTGNRTAMIATVPAMLFGLSSLTHLKTSAKIGIILFLILAFFVLQPFIPNSNLQRLGTIKEQISEGNLNGRMNIWQESLNAFKNPLIGVGSGAFETTNSGRKVAHNVYLSILIEVGIIGLFLFSAILTIVISGVIRQSKFNSSFWLSLLIVWAIGGSALTWEYRKQTWLFLSLAAISASLSTGKNQSRKTTQITVTKKAKFLNVSPTKGELLKKNMN
jgi:O-antigen ligase